MGKIKNKEYYIQSIAVIKALFLSALGALAVVIFYCYQHNEVDKYLILIEIVLTVIATTLFLLLRKFICKVGEFDD